MHHRRLAAAALLASLALSYAAAPAHAQTDTAAVDPGAIAALTKMGDYLRSLNAFQVQATVTTEDVLDDGQKVQTANTGNLVAVRPNRLRLEVNDPNRPRYFYYDGKQFTLWAPRPKYYATVAAPATIGELADQLDEKYDIDLPFVDLFRWGTSESNVSAITRAMDVGPSVVDGITCEQYAFRQDGVDWQLWIQQGEFPLPKKMVITTLTDDARPQHTSLYTWNLAPSFNDQTFAFTPPAGAHKITIAQAKAMRDAEDKKKPGGHDHEER